MFREKSALYSFWTTLFGIIGLFWVVQGLRVIRGISRLPRLTNVAPALDGNCPSIAVLFAARDEAEKLPHALATLLAQDYPDYEVVAVNDRSQDATPQILDNFARANHHLKVVHLSALPPGWLGKPHALWQAYQHARGDWFVFTDADVRFAPDLLRRAVALTQARGWDHLSLVIQIDLEGFWEKVTVNYFGLGFVFGAQPWQADNPKSRSYVGVGAFQLLRRSAYEAIGTHQRLAMEVVEDMKLGKLVKLGGFRSGVAFAGSMVRVRWYSGLRNLIRGVTKNLFAGCGYRLSWALGGITAAFLISILPFLGLLFASGWPRALAGAAALLAIALHAYLIWPTPVSPLYALTHPLGALFFCYMMLRSTVVTLWRGGVEWRDTFYPLEELRKGMV